jgi:hypothetical protein
VQKLSQAKNFQDVIKIQSEFMSAQLNSFNDQARIIGEIYTQAATVVTRDMSVWSGQKRIYVWTGLGLCYAVLVRQGAYGQDEDIMWQENRSQDCNRLLGKWLAQIASHQPKKERRPNTVLLEGRKSDPEVIRKFRKWALRISPSSGFRVPPASSSARSAP